MRRLRAGKELKEYRERELRNQGGVDPITGLRIDAPCLDHDHEAGCVRSVLQRESNAFEGKVYNAWRRYIRHLGVPFERALLGLVSYHERDYSLNPLHPKHRTEDEKRLLRNKRARLKSKKAKLK